MRSVEEIRKAEARRLYFMSQDYLGGVQNAVRFARQGLVVYRKALKTPYGRANRPELIASLLMYRRFVREPNITVVISDLISKGEQHEHES